MSIPDFETTTVHLNVGPPPEIALSNSASLAFAFVALMIAIAFVRRRLAGPQIPAPRHFFRVLAAAAFFAAALNFGEVLFAVIRPDAAPRSSTWVLGNAVSIGATLLLLFWLTDRLFLPFRPTRSRSWLAAALSGFVLIALISAYVPTWHWGPETFEFGTPLLRIIVSGLGAGLVWWSLLPAEGSAALPPQDKALAQIFE